MQWLKDKLKFFEKTIKEIKTSIGKYPEGSLGVSTAIRGNKVYYQYYTRKTGEKTGKYLRKDQEKLIKSLAQKEYMTKAVKVLEKEKRVLARFLKGFDPDALKKIYENMPKGKKELVVPYQYPDKSKSEQIIADRLKDAGIPYRYEFPFVYEGNKVIHTDFTVLNRRTRAEYRWEHFGRMDDPKYRKTFFWKQSLYAQYGYMPGINIIYTFEDKDNPLDTRFVDRLIKKFFL